MQRKQKRYLLKGIPALAAAALLGGCFGDGLQSTIRPESDSARVIHDVYTLVTWIDVGILVVVTALFLYAIIRFRARKGQESEVPPQVHGNPMLEVLWTLIPAVLLIFIAVPTWSGIFRADAPPSTDALQVKAIGHQWWWEFQYPDLGIVTANELYLPNGKTVVVETTSVDVVHAFWLPRLVGKIDSFPDRKNFLWFTPENVDTYYGQCAEFCGTSHANMRFRVHVVSAGDFDAWVTRQKQPPVATSDEARGGQQLFVTKGCIACHAISGVPVAASTIGPNLTNLPDRTTLASGIIDNNPKNLVKWIRETQKVKPGTLMGIEEPPGSRKFRPIEMTGQEAGKIAAYLLSKPGRPAPPAPPPRRGAAARPAAGKSGKQLIVEKACGACHVVPGVPGTVGTVGPNLGGVASRPKIGGGTLDNTPGNMARWLKNPLAVKPDSKMPPLGLNDAEINALVRFLSTLK